MPANSGPASGASLNANAFGFRGGKLNTIVGVTKMDPRRDYGTDGPAGVAASGRMDSGGPNFTTSMQRPSRPWTRRFGITGITYDSTGTPLAGCTVLLLDRSANHVDQETVSDGSGVFTFTVDDNSTTRWGIAAGSGVAGATIGPLTYTVV